jgi:DNA-binding MarR family transcriptional regulator
MAETPLRTVPDLTGMLKHAGHVLETQLTAALAEIGLTPRMQCVLVHALDGERTQRELADLAYIDKTTMVATMDALETAGYAERRPSDTDRRVRIVSVTKAGAEAAAKGQRLVDAVHRDALASLTAGDRTRFLDALVTLVDGRLAEPAATTTPVRRSRQQTH